VGSDLQALEAALQRQERYLEQTYLVTKTFASLQLYDRTAIADTLLSMTATFLESFAGAVFLREKSSSGRLVLTTSMGGVHRTAFDHPPARELFETLAEDGIAQHVTASRLEASAPEIARSLPAGVLAVGLRTGERSIGLLLLAAVRSSSPRDRQAEVSFLTAIAGVGSLALTNASAVSEARDLSASVAAAARAAERDSAAKSKLLGELDRNLATIRAQQEEIQKLSVPVLRVWRGVLVAPLIGVLDSARGSVMTERLLAFVAASQAEAMILDVTGIASVDTVAAQQLVRLIRAVRLLGVELVISGVQPSVATALHGIEAPLHDVDTFSDLEAALRHCIAGIEASDARRARASGGRSRARGAVARAHQKG
jgi:anti-anti-sigma regulatory factor